MLLGALFTCGRAKVPQQRALQHALLGNSLATYDVADALPACSPSGGWFIHPGWSEAPHSQKLKYQWFWYWTPLYCDLSKPKHWHFSQTMVLAELYKHPCSSDQLPQVLAQCTLGLGLGSQPESCTVCSKGTSPGTGDYSPLEKLTASGNSRKHSHSINANKHIATLSVMSLRSQPSFPVEK